MRVLVAEDEEDLCNIIKEKLTDDGYSVDACYNGGDGSRTVPDSQGFCGGQGAGAGSGSE